jgi:hypothetical protein
MVFNLFKLFSTGPDMSGGTITADTVRRIREGRVTNNLQVQGGAPSQLRQALIAADKSFDNALKERFPGETMAERLKNARTFFDRPVYQKIWDAHRMRNSLVHEAGYDPPHFMLKEAVSNLKTATMLLGITL